ncbi:choline-responsive transcriptional repressor BetI [Caenispirillum bisanense]|uniref:HTH-type transcriptional regulator BetI n=1 Tax=Caenispirillum bisanense TaxID=414052 RepID=A0A286G894_9PROT|nr:transcriptional regulator BetI [Caenispirillum bisanense]SOD91731.1 transcriptional regulator, TetR family [Caenispirillum bisanense]
MPKVGVQPIRRKQLIDATIQAIHRYGYGDATVARIASTAGLSAGIIAHYFGGKNELLAATMRSLLTDLRREAIRRLTQADSPLARVEAIVAANFDETQCTPEVVAAWLAFWAQVPHAPELARLQGVYRRRLRSDLRHALRQLKLAERDLDEMTEVLGSLIDGIWLRAALAEDGLDIPAARRRVMTVLRLHLLAAAADA